MMTMSKDEQRDRAEEFLKLHAGDEILILPNAWDVSSARLFELEGFKAVGTTSAGISATLGHPDGQHMSLDDNMEVVGRIVEHVHLPISADVEAGYATSIEGVVKSARAVLNVGAVGLNIEDSTGNPAEPLYDEALQAEKIAAIREMALAEGIPLVINARTDVYLLPDGTPAGRMRETVDRCNAYRRAGADCVFVPDMGTLDKETITRLVHAIDAPINIIAGDRTPPLAELQEIGVARVSLGPKPMRAALALVRRIARELLGAGTYTTMTADTMSYSEVNGMFARQGEGH